MCHARHRRARQPSVGSAARDGQNHIDIHTHGCRQGREPNLTLPVLGLCKSWLTLITHTQ
jgi:hypothetical protein